MRRWLVAVVGMACGARAPAPSWVERDLAPGQQHATATARDDRASTVDAATLSPEAIARLDEATALTLLERSGSAAPAARLALRAARLAYHRGDDAEARTLIARASSAADEAEVHGELAALATKVAMPPVDPSTVAVLLPLSGRFAVLGAELRAAIELAPASGTRWLFLDTRGDPDGALAAVETAVARGAVGILGPIGSREALAAARGAALRRVPIVLLSPDDGADPSARVFRAVGSPADEGRHVARFAAVEQFPTVAVFAPRDDVGQEAAAAFVAEAARLGLQVTAQGDYDPTGGALEDDVKAFLQLVPARNPRFAAHLARHGKKGWTTFSPDVAFSLLYVPDRYDRAALVAAFLPYYGVELRTVEFPDPDRLARKHGGNIPTVVQLVGGSGWNHPSLPIRGGNAVQGARIVDACVAGLGGDTSALFAQAFQQRLGRTASATAAQAHDAALLITIARAAAERAPDPRASLADGLARGKLDDGACGPAVMSAGEVTREPTVLEVSGGQLDVAP